MPQSQGISQGAWKVTLAGVDVTNYCSEKDFTAQDTLGQGPGVASGGSGRATTATIRTRLGPAASAIGAGQALPVKNILSANQSDVESGTSGFGAAGGGVVTLTQDTTQFWHGAASLKVVTDGTASYQGADTIIPFTSVQARTAYTFSVYLKGSGTVNVFVQQVGSPYASYGQLSNVVLTNTWTRYSVVATMPDTLPTGNLGLYVTTGSPGAALTWYEDGLQFERGSFLTDWVLGGTGAAPALVRQGEVKVFDVNGATVFGGYVTHVSDQVGIKESGRRVIYTDAECHDYWQDLDRINVVNKVYDGQTDVFIIKDLLTTYAPSIGQSLLPSSSNNLGPINFKNMSVNKAIQKVADKTGFAVWIDYAKNIHYVSPGNFASAPFSLAQNPNFSSSFSMGFDSYNVDDTGAINRATFYGGKRLSNDYTQDLSPLCNGNADTIPLAYYPHRASDGAFHVTVGGVVQVVGYYGSTGNSNQLKKNGGTADCLVNVDAHTVVFNVAPSNTGVNSVTCRYRYESPLVVQITDQNSVNFYGRYLDGTIHDDSVFDPRIAVARCRTLLLEQSMGLTTLKVRCFKAGIQAGMLLRVDHDDRNIHGSFLVQSVDIKPKGAGYFEYGITAGAWNWNLVDFLFTAAQGASPADDTTDESVTVTQIESMTESVNLVESWTITTRPQGGSTFGTSKFGLASF